MKKTLILALAITTLLAGSCDFVRRIAGRPTAAQVEEIRQERIRREEARLQATLDSLEQVKKRLADSLAAREAYLLDSLTQARGTVLNPAKMGGLFTTKLQAKYLKANGKTIAVALICLLVLAGIAIAVYFMCKDASYSPSPVMARSGSSSGKSLLEQLMDDIQTSRESKKSNSSNGGYQYGTQSADDEAAVASVMANLEPKA